MTSPVAAPVEPDYTQGYEKLENEGTRKVLTYRGRRFYVDVQIEEPALKAFKDEDWQRIARDVVAILAKKKVFENLATFQGASINAEGVTDYRQRTVVMKHSEPTISQPEWDDLCGRITSVRSTLPPLPAPPPPPAPPSIVVEKANAPAVPPAPFSCPASREPAAVGEYVDHCVQQPGLNVFGLLAPEHVRQMSCNLRSTTSPEQQKHIVEELRGKYANLQGVQDEDLVLQYLEWSVREHLRKRALEFQERLVEDAVKKKVSAKEVLDLEALQRALVVDTADADFNKLLFDATAKALRRAQKAYGPREGILPYAWLAVMSLPRRALGIREPLQAE